MTLDYGRATRTVLPALFAVIARRDRGCRFPGCDRPVSRTQAHHIRHWCQGGTTDEGNLALFCGYHHHVIHRPGWNVKLLPTGRIEAAVFGDTDPSASTRPEGRASQCGWTMTATPYTAVAAPTIRDQSVRDAVLLTSAQQRPATAPAMRLRCAAAPHSQACEPCTWSGRPFSAAWARSLRGGFDCIVLATRLSSVALGRERAGGGRSHGAGGGDHPRRIP